MIILALAPHTDDIEFACGASLHKWSERGDIINAVSFSCGTADKAEFNQAVTHLGVSYTKLLNYETRRFGEYRQLILDELIRLDRSIRPDLVLIPSSSDTHQDHQVIREEGFRAFKRTSLIGYEMPQNNLNFTTNMFVRIEEENIQAKIKALKCYESQKERPYISEDFIKGLARVRGMQAGCQYAEAYEVIRWIE